MDEEGKPSIAVCGVGGAGCNTINRLLRMGVSKAELIAFNTDKKHLNLVGDGAKKCLLGYSVTKGLGAGGYPEVAAKCAESSRKAIAELLDGKDIVFLACGMGGGTGTGATPVISRIAREKGAITIAFCTYPFAIERGRMGKAREGISEMKKHADTVVLIDNNRLVDYAGRLPIEKSFEVLDELFAKAIGGISKTLLEPSLLNLDYMDLKAVAQNGGISAICVGEASGYDRVEELPNAVLKNRLLDIDISGAKGVLVHLTGGPDLLLGDANRAGELLTENVAEDANVIYGARIEEGYEKRLEAICIYTGISEPYRLGKR
ncbi:MAG: cell division protein FtsZ [Candidatus Micrarchaeota archaeon]|nr:cell division protein FtsZ [Candidatus Micrarchaeota archaeon]